MIDFKQRAEELLNEVTLCMQAKPRHDAVNIQLEKDAVDKWANLVFQQIRWGSKEHELAEAVYQLESRLKHLKEKLVMEILNN
jgi:uncharacterized protein with PhoU and TrkA domain